MTTPARQREAERVDQVFHVALSQIGLASLEEALALWQSIPPASMARVRTTWLNRATRALRGRRSEARSLGRAYYRLARALRTGSTIADPNKPEPATITLDVLREEFEALLPRPAGQDTDSGSNEIPVEHLSGLAADAERQEREAEREAELVLDALGPTNLGRLFGDLDGKLPYDDIETARAEAYRQAGARQGAAFERLVLNGARAELWTAMEHDERALGYARFSTTGTPCGWCAMLISRGAVYKSAKTAEYADGDKYHDNCHCEALPVFTDEQYDSDPKYALNRQYADEWPKVTRGLSGKAAVSAWRRYIRQQQRAEAQAAKATPTTNVQEA
ncbi:hypothetical protein [Kribbella italica]|uniref:Minor capsid protein n=1 Tax=Kribbella italica TaxID=1540520 RepID=A0A7W9J0J7_9ACTN|nr:hypothetical protein [Kribbella italica]MBB5833419.1 hypothetical protein [Kribbella italica]